MQLTTRCGYPTIPQRMTASRPLLPVVSRWANGRYGIVTGHSVRYFKANTDSSEAKPQNQTPFNQQGV